MGKIVPDTERVYIVFNSCAATRDLTLSKQIKGWGKALDECFGVINAEIDSYNSLINCVKIDHPGFKEVREILENGQNFTIKKHTIGIKDITPDVNYEDYNMKNNCFISVQQARIMYNSGNEALKEIACSIYTEKELVVDYKKITNFRKACDALYLNYGEIKEKVDTIYNISKSSAAMFKLNIIREALNFGQDLHLTKDSEYSCIYYPINPFTTNDSNYYKSEINSGKIEVIGKIKSEGKEYNVIGGGVGCPGNAGLGSFTSLDGVGRGNCNFGFLGCANKEIAKHFGKYFGMLITEAKYGSIINNFEIVESKYEN